MTHHTPRRTRQTVSAETWARVEEFRQLVFSGIKAYFDTGETHCKHYEGAVAVHFPNYFDQDGDFDAWGIALDLYVFGPNRHYEWRGTTLGNALDQAFADVRRWLDEEAKELEQ